MSGWYDAEKWSQVVDLLCMPTEKKEKAKNKIKELLEKGFLLVDIIVNDKGKELSFKFLKEHRLEMKFKTTEGEVDLWDWCADSAEELITKIGG